MNKENDYVVTKRKEEGENQGREGGLRRGKEIYNREICIWKQIRITLLV